MIQNILVLEEDPKYFLFMKLEKPTTTTTTTNVSVSAVVIKQENQLLPDFSTQGFSWEEGKGRGSLSF